MGLLRRRGTAPPANRAVIAYWGPEPIGAAGAASLDVSYNRSTSGRVAREHRGVLASDPYSGVAWRGYATSPQTFHGFAPRIGPNVRVDPPTALPATAPPAATMGHPIDSIRRGLALRQAYGGGR
jgi:hypothetical protein